ALKSARIGCWRYEEHTRRLTGSDSMLELWGLLPGQGFETHASDYQLLHPEDLAQHRARVADARRRLSDWRGEFRAVRPRDGRVIWLEERGTVRLDPRTGKLVLDGLIWDVTERKLAEELLRASERRKTFLLDLDDALRPLVDPIQIQIEA